MVKVKVCGITNLEDAKISLEAGCDALGFVFYKKSPRYIAPPLAKEIIAKLPKGVLKTGVFVNEREKEIKKIAGLCKLDMLQFHGDESPAFCAKFKGYKVIKAFRVKRCLDEKSILRYKPFAYLFDTFTKSEAGGTGKNFDWRLIRHINGLKRPVFLSGGLSAKNVEDAIKCVRPDWVDVCSSLEISPGKKDHRKVKEFIRVVKSASKQN